ncbi:420_t:CDS:2, partial [Dentiscutata heterogama]
MEKISNQFSKDKKDNTPSTDGIDGITKGISELFLNLAKATKVIKKSQCRCSIYNKIGHTFRTCSKRKKAEEKLIQELKEARAQLRQTTTQKLSSTDLKISENNPYTKS